MSPRLYETETTVDVRAECELLADTDQHAERRAKESIGRSIQNALQSEIGSELIELTISIDVDARRVDDD